MKSRVWPSCLCSVASAPAVAMTTTMPYLKLSRQDSFGTPVGVRLSFLYPSPMRGAACEKRKKKKKLPPGGEKKKKVAPLGVSIGQLLSGPSVLSKSDTDHTGSDESKKRQYNHGRASAPPGRVL